MSEPTNGSSPRKRFQSLRGLKGKLTFWRPRSPTPSQTLLRRDHTASPSIGGLDGASDSTSVAGSVNLPVDIHRVSREAANLPGPSGDRARGPMIKLPPKTEPKPSASEQPSDHDEPSLPAGVPDQDESNDVTPDIDPEIERQNILWAELRTSLEMLKEGLSILPDFVSAIETLLSCLEELKTMGGKSSDYEDVTTKLTGLSELIRQEEGGLASVPISDALLGLILLIAEDANKIKAKLDHESSGNTGQGSADEVLQHFRRIELLFRQLQAYTIASARNVPNGSLPNSRLDRLNPVKQAAYNYDLPDKINRRGCTQGTRTAVLAELDDWLSDPTSPSVYWINGMAGIGKTAIAYTFCERMEKRKLLGASFFCTRQSAECKDINRIVPTISYQLAQYSIPFQSALNDALAHNTDAGTKSLPKQFEQLLVETTERVKETLPDQLVVVIDGLDFVLPAGSSESSNRILVELLLDQIFNHAPRMSLKFLITSRPETEIYLKMKSYAQSRAGVLLQDTEKSQIQADIKLYLTQELETMSPTEAEINQLVERSGASFMYAAALVRHAQSDKHLADPRKGVRSLIEMPPEEQQALVDPVYMEVMNTALGDEDLEEDETDDVRIVLNTVLLAQEPISIATIGMLGGITDLQHVENALHPLRSTLHHSEKTGLVSPLDSAFPEIMFSKERSGSYFCDAAEHSQHLALGCFLGMKEQLRFNICELDSSRLFDEKVENIQSRIKNKISPPLAYACRYWANHLNVAAKLDDALLGLLTEFLTTRLLYWMEVLNLRRELDMGVAALLKAKQRLEGTSAHPELVALLDDAYVFMRDFAASSVSRSTPHIYISSLQLCPRSSIVYRIYSNSVKKLLKPHGDVTANQVEVPRDHQSWNVGSGVLSIAYSPDSTLVAVGCEDNTISIYDSHTGLRKVGPLRGHDKWVRCVVFSPDGTRVLSSSSDCTIRMWNSLDGTPIPTLFEGHTHPVRSVAFSFDGNKIVSGSWDDTICIWDASNGNLVAQSTDCHQWGVNCVAFHPGGAFIASGGNDNIVRLWDWTSDAPDATKILNGHTNVVTSIAFTPQGAQLVSSSVDSTTCIWNIDGTLSSCFIQGCSQLTRSMAISSDGLHIVSGSEDSTVKVWDVKTGKLVAGPFMGHSSCIRGVAFSPDGTRLLSGSHDGSVRAWDLQKGSNSSTSRPLFKYKPLRGGVARGSSDRQRNEVLQRTSSKITRTCTRVSTDLVPRTYTRYQMFADMSGVIDRAYQLSKTSNITHIKSGLSIKKSRRAFLSIVIHRSQWHASRGYLMAQI
ncbi:unnamed protein product [Rhizoctonia solani]|uniref:NACHT domain-containing protein n=1 Tax=Rhizoctonia solani TaxID=456999 RepID=A0A8H3ABK2_9AGAM|nr:unnamed protein product [Rhizoctonia solani]